MRFNRDAILNTLGVLVLFLGLALTVPLGFSVFFKDGQVLAFGATIAICISIGGGLTFLYRNSSAELRIREGFAVVALSWLVLSLIGAFPFVFGGALESYTDAFFESMSGFTTTGASILGGSDTPSISSMPESLLFWRSWMHWLGGMGIIVLTIAILPMMGTGGMKLFQAEVPGPSTDKLTPRIRETAKKLWFIYLGLTVIEFFLLWPATGAFGALNHAMSTMASGGFSPLNGSVGEYDSAYVEWVVIIFMMLAGVNFGLFYRALLKEFGQIKKDEELWLYLVIIVGASILVFFSLFESTAWGNTNNAGTVYTSFHDSVRHAFFHVISILTTTGFGSQDYLNWPALAMGIIFLLCFVGGMAGSTSGGVKVIRHVLLYKNSYREIKHLVHPNAVLPLRYNGKVIDKDVIQNIQSFIVFYIALIAGGVLLLSFLGVDLMTAIGSAIACVGNIGPAWGTVGPMSNYAHLPDLSKWLLSFFMLVGRLEIFTVLVLFMPAYWRR